MRSILLLLSLIIEIFLTTIVFAIYDGVRVKTITQNQSYVDHIVILNNFEICSQKLY